MEREILFRGKRKDNGEWVKGLPSYDMNGNLEEIEVYRGFCDCNTYEIDPETVCQYTGFHDNTKWEQLSESEKNKFLSEWNYKKERWNIKEDWNGRKVFEGDICDRKEKFPEIVTYHNGDWTLDYSYASGKESGYNYCNLGFYVKERGGVEVIGNIFDNPELLKGDSK